MLVQNQLDSIFKVVDNRTAVQQVARTTPAIRQTSTGGQSRDNNTMHTEPRAAAIDLQAEKAARPGDR